MSLKDGLWNKHKRYSNLLGIDHISDFSEKNIEEKIDNICNIYSVIKTICDQFKVELIVSTSPLIDKDISRVLITNHEIRAQISSYRNKVFDKVLNHCKTLKIDTIDLRPIFSNKHDLFFDDVHTNNRGSEAIGEYLYQKLNNKLKLYKKNHDILKEHCLFKKISLKNETTWSEKFESLSSFSRNATISFNISCDAKVKSNNALFCIDFDGKVFNTRETLLAVSTIVGCYKYIITKENSHYTISYSFLIPPNVKNIRVGFQLWRSHGEISIESANLFIYTPSKDVETLANSSTDSARS